MKPFITFIQQFKFKNQMIDITKIQTSISPKRPSMRVVGSSRPVSKVSLKENLVEMPLLKKNSIGSLSSKFLASEQKMKRAIQKLGQHKYNQFKQLFLRFDVDNSGSLSPNEVYGMLNCVGHKCSNNEVLEIIQDFDANNDGKIDFYEFLDIFIFPVQGSNSMSIESQKKLKKVAAQSIQEREEQSEQSQKSEKSKQSEDSEKPVEISGEQVKVSRKPPVFEKVPEKMTPRMIEIFGTKYQYEKGVNFDSMKLYVDREHYRQKEMKEIENKWLTLFDNADTIPIDADEEARKTTKTMLVQKYDKFHWWSSDIGHLAFGKDARKLTEVEVEMGSGLTIYFRQLKILMILFLVFSVIAFPMQLMIMGGSNESQLRTQNIAYMEGPGFFSLKNWREMLNGLFFKLTLASLGKSDFPCESFYISDMQENFSEGPIKLKDPVYNSQGILIQPAVFGQDPVNITTIDLKCKVGHITNLINIGVSTQETNCPSQNLDNVLHVSSMLESLNLDPLCSFRGLANDSNEFKIINDEFSRIMGQSNETFSFNARSMFTPECYQHVLNLNFISQSNPNFGWKPQIVTFVHCAESNLINPFTGEESVTRKSLLILCATTDLIITGFFLLLLSFIIKISEQAMLEFKDSNMKLETRDFAIQVTNFPPASEFKNEMILKAMLWQHFQDVIKSTEQQIKGLLKFQKYQNQIIDIFFGLKEYGAVTYLLDISNKYKKLQYLHTVEENTGKKHTRKIQQLQKQIEKQKERYIKAQNSEFEKEQEYLKKGKPPSNNFKIAFVVFRSMEGQNRVLVRYKDGSLASRWKGIKNKIFCRPKEKMKRDERPKFMEKYNLDVEQACDTNLINWDGFGVSVRQSCQKRFQSMGIKILVISLVFASLFAAKYARQHLEVRYPQYNIQNLNPQRNSSYVSEEQAELDHDNGTYKSFESFDTTFTIGYMSVYCDQQMNGNILRGMEPKSPEDIKFTDGIPHCQNLENSRTYIGLLDFALAFVIACINNLTIWLFQCTSWCQRKETKTIQNRYELYQSVFLMFFNTALFVSLAHLRVQPLIRILTSDMTWLSFISEDFNTFNLSYIVDYLPILNGEFQDITVGWHEKAGAMICLILLLHIILEQMKQLCSFGCFRLRQRFDRTCSKKEKGTLRKTQKDLNDLYTGPEFNLTSHYANLHYVCWITMCFSSSMPALYVLAAIYFSSTLFLQKYLVFNFYKKSYSFNEQLPLSSLSLFKWPIVLHFFFSILVFSEGQVFFNAEMDLGDIGLQKLESEIFKFTQHPNRNHSYLKTQSQKAEEVIEEIYSSKLNIFSRLRRFHIIMILLIWLLMWMTYLFSDKLVGCYNAICAKCRGDGEFEYDTEDDEDEHVDIEPDCPRCVQKERQIEEKNQRVRDIFEMRERDNNQFGTERQVERDGIDRYKTDESSEEEDMSSLKIASLVRKKREAFRMKIHFADDFLQEVSVETLLYYHDRNQEELKRSINAMMCTQYFIPKVARQRKLGYVGGVFTKEHMKEMVGVFKMRRHTFHRRLFQIMKLINPKIYQYFQVESKTEQQRLFHEQHEAIRDLIRNQENYVKKKSQMSWKSTGPIFTIDPKSHEHRLKLASYEHNTRVDSNVQTYDFRHSNFYKGVHEIQNEYVDEAKNELNTIELKQPSSRGGLSFEPGAHQNTVDVLLTVANKWQTKTKSSLAKKTLQSSFSSVNLSLESDLDRSHNRSNQEYSKNVTRIQIASALQSYMSKNSSQFKNQTETITSKERSKR